MRRWRSPARAAAWRCVRTGISCGESVSSLARAVATNGCAGSATERRSRRARHAARNSRRRAPTPSSARARVGKKRIVRRSPLRSRADRARPFIQIRARRVWVDVLSKAEPTQPGEVLQSRTGRLSARAHRRGHQPNSCKACPQGLTGASGHASIRTLS
jgi:hypothetical protein